MSAIEQVPYYPETQHLEGPRIHVAEDPTDPYWTAAEANEFAVFHEKGYVETADELKQEYAPYVPNTRMIALEVPVERDDGAQEAQVIGSVRMIDYRIGQGLKTINDAVAGRLEISEEGWAALDSCDPRTLTEVGTIALHKDYRRGLGQYAGLLYGEIYSIAAETGHTNLIASFDEDYFRGFSRYFGRAVMQIGEARDYMGSKTVPALMDATKAEYDADSNSFKILDDSF